MNTNTNTKNNKQSITDIALNAFELWRDADGNAYATEKGSNQDNYALTSGAFARCLSGAIYAAMKVAVRKEHIDEAVRILEHEARKGPIYPVGIRVCGYQNKVHLDLCDETRRVVEVDASGWRFVAPSPVKFLRKPAMSALPAPETGGDLRAFTSVLNFPDANAQMLVIGFMLGILMPAGSFVILVLSGEQGTGKTTAAKAIKFIVDPSDKAPLRSRPKDEPQLLLWAQGCRVLAIDNLSHLPQWLSDSLCRLSSGGGHSVRKLYTDGDEFFLDAQRPVILTGIEDIVNRGDLIDRSVIIQLPQISDEMRVADEEVWQILTRERPRILGALLDAVSCALKKRESIELPCKPRMADFAVWVTAAEEALAWRPGSFLDTYLSNRREASEIGLESSMFFKLLCACLSPGESFKGTATELHRRMRAAIHTAAIEDTRVLPKNASKTSGELRKIAPALRQTGWKVNFPPRGKQRVIEIDRQGEEVRKSAVDSVDATISPPVDLP